MSGEEAFVEVGETAEQLREELLRDEEVARLWRESEPRRRLADTLISMRKSANLTQREVASRGRWDQSHVSRMESATGPWPQPESVRTYADICGFSAGYVFAHAMGEEVHIDGAVSFGNSEADQMLERIVDKAVRPREM